MRRVFKRVEPENSRFLHDLLIAGVTSIATGYFVYLAALRAPLKLARKKARKIVKRFQLRAGITSLEQIIFQYETEDYKSHSLNLTTYNGSEFAMHNVEAYRTIDYRPEDLSWSEGPRLIDSTEPPQPAIREPLWWKTGNRSSLSRPTSDQEKQLRYYLLDLKIQGVALNLLPTLTMILFLDQ